ncbi:hypothetical protein K1719_021716 [Acacia pycnantha]|nr:hypothetical protein K1719_021716 [Acacia pycnantha]
MGVGASSSSSKKYDVFLSFRGEDTHRSFTSHLHSALCLKGIETFINYELPKGDGISQSLIQAIENSSLSVIIFSKNYASSKWCLNELIEILHHKKEKGQLVVPIFYQVDPSHVRHQRGAYGEAFAQHLKENPDKVDEWRKALLEIANLSGWDSYSCRDEAELIQNIASDIIQKLNHGLSSALANIVGIDENCDAIELLLEQFSTVGIWGMRGIGKTTMAKVVFAKFYSQFDGSCFLENFREKSEKHGLKYIHDKLVNELSIDGSLEGLNHRKVLIVLDDVSDTNQLDYLEDETPPLRHGSKVIITSRDRHVLEKRVERVHKAIALGYDNSLKLFNLKAFPKDGYKSEYKELVERALAYAQGVPLTLTRLGSFLHSKTIEEWESALSMLEKRTLPNVQDVLQLSYDGLDDEERKVFLDLAFFLKGEYLKELNLKGYKVETLPEAIFKPHKIEILSLEHCSQLLELPPQIAKLENLRELRLSGCERLETLPQEIWELPNLEVCDLSGTHITELPPSLNFPNLRSLLLGNNLNLMKIPSTFFHHAPLLTVLDLSRTSIHELPSSIFNLKQLRELYLKDCELFVEFSPEIQRLRELVTLDLEGTLITHLPMEIQELTNLESLSLSFYNDSSHDSEFDVIPYGILTQLKHLEVLRIHVNSDNEWWLSHFDNVLVQISSLRKLRVLDVYIPGDKFGATIEKSLSNFRFIVGYHKPRMISRVPPAIEAMFKESSRSLKFINGQDFPDRVETILSKSWAFFLDRHMTIKNLIQFKLKNLKQLRLCILAECNEMHSILDVEEYEADSDLDESFCMQFLTVFYMKNLRTVINKPNHGNSIFCELKLLALHTCPELTTIFTMHFLHSLVNLEELIVEDCPKVSCIISCPSSEPTTNFFLPRLRKLSLLFVPELASISNGVRIGRNLEQVGLYYCPKLQSLSTAELSSEQLKKIRGETKWWEKLKWSEADWGQKDPPHQFNNIFSPIDEDLDILTQLTTYELMTSFNKKKDSGEQEFSSEESDSESSEWY